MSAPSKRIERDKTLTADFVKSAQIDIRWFNQHDLDIAYNPDGGSGSGVQLRIKVFGSADSLGTARDSSRWKRLGVHEDLVLDGVQTFTADELRARAEKTDELAQVFQFNYGGKKMYIEYREIGSPGTFGTFDADLNSSPA